MHVECPLTLVGEQLQDWFQTGWQVPWAIQPMKGDLYYQSTKFDHFDQDNASRAIKSMFEAKLTVSYFTLIE